MSTLKEKIQTTEAYLFGNRIAASSIAAVVAISFTKPESHVQAVIQALLSPYFVLLAAYTGFGLTTGAIYKRTTNHLNQFGRLDEDFFKTYMGYDAKKPFTGYCQLQGMYLACRDLGHLDEFKRMKKAYTKNIIPNF